jgi:hypothetical protein
LNKSTIESYTWEFFVLSLYQDAQRLYDLPFGR